MSLLLGKFKNRYLTSGAGVPESVRLKDAYTKMVLLTLGGVVSSTILQVGHFINLDRLADKPAPTLVQLSDGNSIGVGTIGSDERTEESIRRFVGDILTAIFTWSGMIPGPETGQFLPDAGVIVSDGDGRRAGRVTTAAWEATYGLELNFRNEFLSRLAALIPESVFGRGTNVAFVPLKIDRPEKVIGGKWKVKVYSNLLFVTGSRVDEIVPYNVEVYVRAVPELTTPALERTLDTKSKPLALLISRARRGGMEIEAIVPLEEETLK